jgi:hypothetical protein
MSTTSLSTATPSAWGRRIERSLAVAASAAAAAFVWLAASAGLGLDLAQPGFGSQPPQPLPLWWVTSVTVLAGVAGWGALTLIERMSGRPAVLWLAASAGALVLSLGGPFSGEGIAMTNRVALAAMHLAAGAVLIVLFYRSARRRMEARR